MTDYIMTVFVSKENIKEAQKLILSNDHIFWGISHIIKTEDIK